jgi:hypothetical protein
MYGNRTKGTNIKALIIRPNTTMQIWYESFIIHYSVFRLSDRSLSGGYRIHKNNNNKGREASLSVCLSVCLSLSLSLSAVVRIIKKYYSKNGIIGLN